MASKEQSHAERSRQRARDNGRYAKHNPCYLCNKSAGAIYLSHPLTDGTGSDGVAFGDIALCLCKRCEAATNEMTTTAQIKEYAKKYEAQG